MWLFTKDGFYSVVEHPGDPGYAMVRGRRRKHMEVLRDRYLGPDYAIHETPYRDYPFRIYVHKTKWAEVAAILALEIDYTNFKNTQPRLEHDIYLGVWGKLLELEDQPHPFTSLLETYWPERGLRWESRPQSPLPGKPSRGESGRGRRRRGDGAARVRPRKRRTRR